MTTTLSTNPAAQRMHEEHEHLAEALHLLETEIPLESLRGGLAELDRLLRDHFAGEEASDGVFRWIEGVVPNRAHQTQMLCDEHRVLADRVEGLRAELEAIFAGPIAALRRRVVDLVTDLREHERTETELVTETIWTDVGGES